MSQLIRERIVPRFSNETLSELGDAARLTLSSSDICFTTDSYVVKPLFFRGATSASSPSADRERPGGVGVEAAGVVARFDHRGGIRAVASGANPSKHQRCGSQQQREHRDGDTKTVERGSADGIFINTAGIGLRLPNVELGLREIRIGDQVLVSGTLGDHGMTIVSQREGIRFESQLESDCAGLAGLTCRLFETVAGIRFMRDPTRGGLAATLNEIVEGSRLSVEIIEKEIPIRPEVQAAADMLGFDVLNAANEGKFVAVVSPRPPRSACGSAGITRWAQTQGSLARLSRRAIRRLWNCGRRSAVDGLCRCPMDANCRGSADARSRGGARSDGCDPAGGREAARQARSRENELRGAEPDQ